MFIGKLKFKKVMHVYIGQNLTKVMHVYMSALLFMFTAITLFLTYFVK